MSRYGHTIYGTRGGPTGPQPWGTSTQTPDKIYLHILNRSTADGDGWLTLTGTESLAARQVRDAVDKTAVTSRRDAGGQLQVKIDKESDLIDQVLIVARSAN